MYVIVVSRIRYMGLFLVLVCFVYESGSFKNNRRHGEVRRYIVYVLMFKGTLKDRLKTSIGQWVDGVLHGHSKIISENGDRFFKWG